MTGRLIRTINIIRNKHQFDSNVMWHQYLLMCKKETFLKRAVLILSTGMGHILSIRFWVFRYLLLCKSLSSYIVAILRCSETISIAKTNETSGCSIFNVATELLPHKRIIFSCSKLFSSERKLNIRMFHIFYISILDRRVQRQINNLLKEITWSAILNPDIVKRTTYGERIG